jgi:hypothetical protein
LKDLLQEIAGEFGVTKKRIWAAVRRASSGMGVGWNGWHYVRRPITDVERIELNVPAEAVVLCLTGPERPCFFIYPAKYKDKYQNEKTTVCASSLAYLRSLGIGRIRPPEPRTAMMQVDGHAVPVEITDHEFVLSEEDDLEP